MPGPSLEQQYAALRAAETTQLTADEERRFREWAARNNVRDVDRPDSYYDYRGFWKQMPSARIRGGIDHFPDTYKQHGHPTFSNESQYQANDAGSWNGEQFTPAPAQLEDQYVRQTAATDPDLAQRQASAAYLEQLRRRLEALTAATPKPKK